MWVQRFSTEEVPERERFGFWHDAMATALIPTVMGSEHADAFRAEARVVDLGAVQVTALRYPPLVTRRTPRLIRRADPGYYQVSLTLSGEMAISQAGRDTAFRAGDLMVYDSSLPFVGVTRHATGRLDHIVAQFPKELLPLPAREAERVVALRMDGGSGFGRLLAGFLTTLAADPGAFRPEEGPRLTTVLMDLLAGAAAARLDAEAAPAPESRRRALFLRTQDFVRGRLADPDLTPGTVAAAHHISVRYLHRLYQDEGLTVGTWIRDLRLAGAARDLADPALRRTPVHDIAVRWGFRHPAAFSRAFRAAHGRSPSEHRECAQSQ
ncbi:MULTISPECIES: AraC family transcriptional regulator [Streptomyces]|uniref:AraC family transcriptional regulator n=1 Tax=Streptomyces viridochromogenes TaxID=1938 RepID=A0A0L8L326_STRVR|nr:MULTISPECIES: AraC family transcriptional regulator [Streptomyces]KOG32520.1 AraC family transcriptional regulator [Streptomyces viridochromogenes]